MFYVYSPGGQLFAGTLEQLRKTQALGAVTKVRSPDRAVDGHDGATIDQASQTSQNTARQLHMRQAYEAPARQPLTRVGDVIRRPAHVVPATANAREAWQILKAHGIGQAPVVDPQNILVGLITRAEMLPAQMLANSLDALGNWQTILNSPVSRLMWTPVPSTHIETDLRRVASVLLETRLPGLPVTDSVGLVIGFVSRTDLMRAIAADPPLDLWS